MPSSTKLPRRISLTQYLVEQQREHGRIQPPLRLLIEVVARACKRIAIAVNKGALGDVLGSTDQSNVQGEVVKKLDVIANEVLVEANEWGGHLAAMASEEMDSIHVVPNRYPQGEFLLLFDPLDGSSNIDVNVSIGTIFSVLRKVGHGRGVSEDDFLQPGKHQAAAGYCVYGPQTTLNGILEKHTGVDPFDATERQLTAIRAGRLGTYRDEALGSVPVNFVASLDITGGNSGSPTLNSKAELVGLAFDGNYESISSGWLFNPQITRSIQVDVRYMLWIMDAVDSAHGLLREMGVKPQFE